MAAKKKTKYMAKGGKTSKYMAKGGKTSKYMAKGGKTTKGMAKGGAMKKSKGMARGGMSGGMAMNDRDMKMMARGMRLMRNGGRLTAAQEAKLPKNLVEEIKKKRDIKSKKKPTRKA